ncbi:MAG: type II toxin-antitoxin system Phd/YefM family antitoxin [Lachnospiraceae bacterium]|nr:type II toxin-antitoxin system Phd/YefM family antitoxin [Kineothrix sp.]MCX4352667.1 type II toxin-antitoxin system Phd/YefM family antitoxin [Lachnospiraceae bacterium]
MIQIRPVSDLRNKFPDIERIVNTGEPVYLTKNGYGAMVVLSLDTYSKLTDGVEAALDEADKMAEVDSRRMSHEEVFGSLRRKIDAQ